MITPAYSTLRRDFFSYIYNENLRFAERYVEFNIAANDAQILTRPTFPYRTLVKFHAF
jgi:hypothetical protein